MPIVQDRPLPFRLELVPADDSRLDLRTGKDHFLDRAKVFLQQLLKVFLQKIKKGGKLSEVINSYPKLFTPVVTQMVAIGEETGELDNILVELAEFYEEEVDQIMENLPSPH
jgi:type II secretory pathway component PulF